MSCGQSVPLPLQLHPHTLRIYTELFHCGSTAPAASEVVRGSYAAYGIIVASE